MTEREAYIGLNMIEGLGPVRVRAMIDALGSPSRILSASAAELERVRGVGAKLAQSVCEQAAALDIAAELERIYEAGVRLITPLDEEYPPDLKTIHDPPLALYVWGRLTEADRQAFAVVGSRRASTYGIGTADRFAFQLAQTGFTVVSGLARGIDAAAHRGALKARGRTIAVLGGALDRLYPPEHAELAEQIAEQGAVLSEYPMGRQADRQTFPYRNRIVSGMSKGVMVVESGVKGGSMHTADAALEQGRTVFAVPGRIDSPASRGPHRLIKNGACLVDTLDDILHEFAFCAPAMQQELALDEPVLRSDLPVSGEERKLVEALWNGGLHADELAVRSGLPARRVNALLLGLEMKRVIRMLPGRQVELRDDIWKVNG